MDGGRWKAKAVISVSLSDKHLEHLRGCDTGFAVWQVILDLFHRKSLMNGLAARRQFYSVRMEDSETVITSFPRVCQLAADLKSMRAQFADQEVAMTILSGLLRRFEHLIVAIDAVVDDKTLTTEFLKSRLIIEEQQMYVRAPILPSTNSTPVNSTVKNRASRSALEC